jgi:DNA polymerase delta subunit 2
MSSEPSRLDHLRSESGVVGPPTGGVARLLGVLIRVESRMPRADASSILTTGGQTIDDIFKYLPSTSRLAMAKRTLEWRHIAPTAPDTLCKLPNLIPIAPDKTTWKAHSIGIYPFPDQDPFILKARPDIYIVGNQPEFETALVGGTSLSLCSAWRCSGATERISR